MNASKLLIAGAFAALGNLPVLPGPCAMFRYSGLNASRTFGDVSETALEHFNNLVATSPENTSTVKENVKLAEDRIPSYSIVSHGEAKAYTTWVDGAMFKFQAETTLRAFVLQRRRWINGAFNCYIWNTLVRFFCVTLFN